MLIGVSGHMRSGKSEVAAYLQRTHHFVPINFADALKREVGRTLKRTLSEYVRTVYGCNGQEQIDGKIADLLYINRDPVTRALLQEWGTDLRRADDPQYWVRKWQTAFLDSGAANVTACDVRFANEARAVLGCGGFLWLVRRPGAGGNGHASEDFCETFTGWNVVLENTGTLEELCAQAERAFTEHERAIGSHS
jgi:hypothetical protein